MRNFILAAFCIASVLTADTDRKRNHQSLSHHQDASTKTTKASAGNTFETEALNSTEIYYSFSSHLLNAYICFYVSGILPVQDLEI